MDNIAMVVAGGDSFTAHLQEPNLAWPNHIKDWIASVRTVAEMASDNELIARNVIKGLEDNDATHCIVGWSDPNRFSLYVNQEHPLYLEIHDKMKTHAGFTNQILTGEWHCSTQGSFIKPGGGYGEWDSGSDIVNDLIKKYITNFHNREHQMMKTYESIIMVQEYCANRSIELLNFKAWDHDLFHTTYPMTKHLEKLIDKDNWWFYNKKAGLKEWCQDKGDDEMPGGHPTTEYQYLFAISVIEPFITGE
jgi:hypothetical protein